MWLHWEYHLYSHNAKSGYWFIKIVWANYTEKKKEHVCISTESLMGWGTSSISVHFLELKRQIPPNWRNHKTVEECYSRVQYPSSSSEKPQLLPRDFKDQACWLLLFPHRRDVGRISVRPTCFSQLTACTCPPTVHSLRVSGVLEHRQWKGTEGHLTCTAKGILATMLRWDFRMAWKLWSHPHPSCKCSVSPINILVPQAGLWGTHTLVCCLCPIRRGWALGIRYREGWAETAVSYWDI